MNEMIAIETKGVHNLMPSNGVCGEGSRNGFLPMTEFDARLTTNRLSAPECGIDCAMPLRKSLTTSSLVDSNEGMMVVVRLISTNQLLQLDKYRC